MEGNLKNIWELIRKTRLFETFEGYLIEINQEIFSIKWKFKKKLRRTWRKLHSSFRKTLREIRGNLKQIQGKFVISKYDEILKKFPKRRNISENSKKFIRINGVFTCVFTCRRVACEDTKRAAYSQLCLYVTGEYNHQQGGISSQTTEYIACHPVYTWVHSFSRSQKLKISSV